MREPWVDELVGTGDSIRELFDARLRQELSARWTESGEEFISLEPDDVARDRSSRRWLAVPALAAAVTLAVVAMIVVSNDPAVTNDTTVRSTVPEPSPVDVDDIAGLTWLVSDVDDQTPRYDAPWFLLLPDGRLEGFDGCNRYFGEYELTDSVLTVGDRFARSGYPCEEASWIGTMLASGAVRLGDDLTTAGRRKRLFDGETEDIEMRAIAVESLPASETSVVGTYFDFGSKRTVELGDGGAVGLKGVERCGEIGRWQIDDGHLVIRNTVPDADVVCRGAAINGRGGVVAGGSILISSNVEGRLREVVTLVRLDKYEVVAD